MLLSIFNLGVLALLALFIGLYIVRYRGLDPEKFSPAAAWTRACIYFCACFVVSWLTGTQAMILESPVVTAAQLQNPAWIAWTVGLTVLILAAYWGIWGRYTLRFDRKLHLATQIPFGLIWGAAMGQVILIVWHGVSRVGASWADWQIVVVAWTLLGIWQWIWQDMCWDLYVAPEHDTKWSIIVKTMITHLPQVTLCLIYVTLYNNFLILIALQTLALIGASVFMRLPPWWSTESTPPAKRYPFILGLYRAGGYVSPDPKTDPYLKAAHLPY
jgi:hypothetical protein